VVNHRFESVKVSGFTPNLISQFYDYDLILTSPGNLYFESLYLEIPTLGVCQNKKQESDFHKYPLVFKQCQLTTVLNNINYYYSASRDVSKILSSICGTKVKQICNLIINLS